MDLTDPYTILTQIAADALGLRMEDVTAQVGTSSPSEAPVEDGSWTAASAGRCARRPWRTTRSASS